MINNSELIINERGAIYHINMRPDEIADTIITVGDPDRVQMVSQFFDTIECSNEHREFRWCTGNLKGQLITVISTGIGPDNIDIVFNELDALVNIDFKTRELKPNLKSLSIIRLGTSGALQDDIAVDSMIISEMAVGLDNVLHFYKYYNDDTENIILDEFQKQVLETSHAQDIKPYVATASKNLLDKFGGIRKGITVTAPGFYAPQGRILRLPLGMPSLVDSLSTFRSTTGKLLTNFEMETSTMLGLAKLMNHECVSISNIIANRPLGQFSKDPYASTLLMIENCLNVICS